MSRQYLQFLLVPDGSAARRARRVLADRGAFSGVVIGTWLELIEWARSAYLVPDPGENSDRDFIRALEEIKDAFWAESFATAPLETSEAVKSALIEIISSTDPMSDIDITGLEDLSERPRRHLDDLFRLARLLDGCLPSELSTAQSLLFTDSDDALHHIRVYHVEGVPRLTKWQSMLVEKLNQNAGASMSDEVLTKTINEVLIRDSTGKFDNSLGIVQERLFEVVADRSEVDGSVQWVGTRDFLQEAEVATGMVQTMLAENPELKSSDIGLLVPDSFEYANALEDTFHLSGTAISGLPVERWRRDLGREVVFHFLYCRQNPAPAMALAICLSSPLMPWSREEGAALAQTVMDGDYRLRPLPSFGRDGQVMLDLLRNGDSEPVSLTRALPKFVSLLRSDEDIVGHVQQAKVAIEQLREFLENVEAIDWVGLRRTVTPKFITSGESPDFNLEGVTVWRESQEPWRQVRCLIVLGFSQGHYPSVLASDPVFSADDLESIRTFTGLPVSTASDLLEQRRQRFKRQLAAISDSVTFLVPRRDPRGERQSPSESLVFMHQLFSGPESANERIFELDSANDRVQVRHLAVASSEHPQPPRDFLADDLRFDQDLLALRTDTEGQLKPESPSSLETLMVSRLAWLLRRLEAEPLFWESESADPALLGTLAHKVFEGLFRPGEELLDPVEVPGRVETLLDEAIQYLAPFLRAAQWQVERRHLVAETVKAAQVWRDVLGRLGAEVLAGEAWLKGTWSSIPIHGQTDLILGLPGDRLLVVDYKRSKSTSRRPRMEKGYDSQASLYRAMLESGGPKGDANETLLSRVRKASGTGIVYYMLNDQVSLVDSVLPESSAVPGWQLLENDVASQAMVLIQRRLAEARAGEARLNRDSDAEFFEKQAGIKPYALKNSPLIDLFTVPGEAEEAQ